MGDIARWNSMLACSLHICALSFFYQQTIMCVFNWRIQMKAMVRWLTSTKKLSFLVIQSNCEVRRLCATCRRKLDKLVKDLWSNPYPSSCKGRSKDYAICLRNMRKSKTKRDTSTRIWMILCWMEVMASRHLSSWLVWIKTSVGNLLLTVAGKSKKSSLSKEVQFF